MRIPRQENRSGLHDSLLLPPRNGKKRRTKTTSYSVLYLDKEQCVGLDSHEIDLAKWTPDIRSDRGNISCVEEACRTLLPKLTYCFD